MADLFDRFLDRLTAGGQRRRVKKVAVLAIVLLIFFAALSSYVALYKIELRIHADGKVVSVEGGRCPVVKFLISNEYLDMVGIGQEVIVENEETSSRYRGFNIRRIDKNESAESDYFSAVATCQKPYPEMRDLKPGTSVKCSIIFEKREVLSVLLKK